MFEPLAHTRVSFRAYLYKTLEKPQALMERSVGLCTMARNSMDHDTVVDDKPASESSQYDGTNAPVST